MTDEETKEKVTLPAGPRCRKCGHMPCPFCIDWCDSLIGEDQDLCCDGKCDFDPEELARWQETIGPILDATPDGVNVGVEGDT